MTDALIALLIFWVIALAYATDQCAHEGSIPLLKNYAVPCVYLSDASRSRRPPEKQ